MSRRASPTAIGAFVLGAFGLLVVGLLVWGGGRFTADWETMVLYFRSSTAGLTVGAPVVLKGVQIGSVTDISVQYDRALGGFLVPVHIRIDQDKVAWPGALQPGLSGQAAYEGALQEGLRARLGLQSLLTGLLQVEIGFFPDTPLVLMAEGSPYRELPTIPSELEQFREELLQIPVERIVSELTGVLEGLNRLVSSRELADTLASLDRAAADLSAAAADARAAIGPAGASLVRTLEATHGLVERVGPRVEILVTGLADTSERLGRLAERADAELAPLLAGVGGDVKRIGDAADRALASADRAFAGVADAVDRGSPLYARALEALRSVDDAADALRQLASYLERNPEALVRGKR